MSDTEIDQNLYDSDQEVSKFHSKLIENVTQLDKRQRVKRAERSEPSLVVSEHHLVKSGATDEDVVGTRDLIRSLERKGDQGNIIKKLQYIQKKNKILPKPLEKPAAERIKRTVGYDKVKEELQEWASIVAKNRTAEQLSFPLKRLPAVKDSHASNIPAFLRGFNTKSDLMKKIEAVDPTLLYPPDNEKEDKKYKLTLEEIMWRRKEAARFRAQQSYREAKAHRQRKIKSKKFHRIQRKDKIKQQLKDFEKLKDSNPQEALAKLEQLDKTRAEERISLRHKNTGQWARNKQIKAKYNKETRQILAEQLAISKELTQKVKRTDSDEEDEDEEDEEIVDNLKDKEYEDEILLKNKEDNVKTEPKIVETIEISDFTKLCQDYYDNKQRTKEKEKIEGDGISDEITSKKEKGASCYAEKKNTSLANKRNMKSELCSNEESTLQASNTEDKLHDNKKRNTSHANTNDTKSKSRGNKKSSTLQANTSNTKSKLNGNEKSHILDADTNNIKMKSNKKISNLVIDTNDVKNKIGKRKKNKESSISNEDSTSKHKKFKSRDMNEMLDSIELRKKTLKLKKQEVKKKCKANNKIEKHEDENRDENEDYSPSLEFEDPKRKPILDSPLEEITSRENVQKDSNLTSLKTIAKSMIQKPADISHDVEIDPKKYINIKPKHLKTQLPELTTGGDEDSDQEEEIHKIISEAFADDDVVEEFRKEKEEEMKKSQLENIDLSLPGWGSWGGPNIKKNKLARKKSRFILNVPKVMPRKPENQGKVIVFEHENEKLRKHLVKELPYPFTRVKDFEASIRAPIGKTFVPMNAHLRLIQPAVKTKLGQVIEPMDENELVKKQPIVKKPLKRIAAKTDKKKNIVKKRTNKKERKQKV